MEHFRRDEFECKCGCGFDTVDFELAIIMDDVRKHFNERVFITSGCRCFKHNANVGGSINSQHTKGKACDFKVEHVTADKVADYLEVKYPYRYGIGRYDNWTHVDSRLEKSRWDKRT